MLVGDLIRCCNGGRVSEVSELVDDAHHGAKGM